MLKATRYILVTVLTLLIIGFISLLSIKDGEMAESFAFAINTLGFVYYLILLLTTFCTKNESVIASILALAILPLLFFVFLVL